MRRSGRSAGGSNGGVGTIWLAAGGTAGHLNAAIAVLQELQGVAPAVLITTDRNIDVTLSADLGVPTVRLAGTGLGRGLGPVVRAAWVDLRALGRNLVELRRLPKPDAVIAFGGFHTPLAALVARARGAKVFVLEQNAVLGRANSLVAVFASRILLAFPAALPGRLYPRAVLVGNPVRSRGAVEKRAARKRLGMEEDGFVVVTTSGSLGSTKVNQVVSELAGLLGKLPGVELWHFVGQRNAGDGAASGGAYHRMGFSDELLNYMAAADLVISRAGASTLSELATVGAPSVLVPLPGSPRDHQRRNAEVFSRAGAAWVIEEAELEANALLERVGWAMEHRQALEEMGAAAQALAKREAARAVVEEVASCLRPRG